MIGEISSFFLDSSFRLPFFAIFIASLHQMKIKAITLIVTNANPANNMS
jgi:hypothetical protein